MMTVHEVSRLAGVSVRTLQYYDRIGLLCPQERSGAGYRLYGEQDLGRLGDILLFRELEFSLNEIKEILDRPGFDRSLAIKQQIEMLTLKKEHLDNLITFALGIQKTGAQPMDFSAFDNSKLDEYAKRAKEQWGETSAYKEYAEKSKNRTKKDQKLLGERFMLLFKEAGAMKGYDPASPEAQDLVSRIQSYITENMYTCTDEILSGLGQMYSAGGEFTENIDACGGTGTAAFVSKAIMIHCKIKQ